MELFVEIVEAIFGFLFTTSTLILTATFPKKLREKYHILKFFDGRKGILLILILFSTFAFFFTRPIISFRISDSNKKIVSQNDKLFSDSTFNVLILPFNKIQEIEQIKLKFERALHIRFESLKDSKYYTNYLKNKIQIKYLPVKSEFLATDSIKTIAKNHNVDFAIWGELYQIKKNMNKAVLKYLIPQNNYFKFRNDYDSQTIQFNSLFEISEGTIVKDFDFIILWILITKLFIDHEVERAKEILSVLENNFAHIKKMSLIYTYFGQYHYSRKEYDLAKPYYKKALKNYPLNSQTLNHYAATLINGYQDTINATKFLEKAIKIDPTNYRAISNYIILLFEQKPKDKTTILRKHLSTVSKLKPDSSLHLSLWGHFYLEYEKNIDSAIHYLSKSLAIFQNDSETNKDLGMAYAYKKKYGKAKEYFNFSIALNDSIGNVYYNLAAVELASGTDTNEVKGLFLRAIKYGFHNPIAYRHLGYIYQRINKIDSAIFYLEKSKQYDSESTYAYIQLIYLYEEKKDYSKMKQNLYEVIKRKPSDDIALYSYGSFLSEHFDNKDSASIYYRKSLKKNNTNYDARLHLANYYYFQKNDIDSAEIHLRTLVKLYPKETKPLNNLMIILLDDKKDTNEAKRIYLDAIKLNPSNKNRMIDSLLGILK